MELHDLIAPSRTIENDARPIKGDNDSDLLKGLRDRQTKESAKIGAEKIESNDHYDSDLRKKFKDELKSLEKSPYATPAEKKDLKKSFSDLPAETNENVTSQPKKRAELPPEGTIDFSESEEKSSVVAEWQSEKLLVVLLSLVLIAMSLYVLVWLWNRFLRNRMSRTGIPMEVLGENFLDASTKIIFLKLGEKVLVMAKSSHYCNTIDVITDQHEINLLALGAGADGNDAGFKKIMGEMKKKNHEAQHSPKGELHKELDQLKTQLNQLQR